MSIDPTIAVVAVGAILLVGSLVGMFVATFWGLRRIIADAIRIEIGGRLDRIEEWRSRVDDGMRTTKADEAEILTRLRQAEAEIAVIRASK